jgi:threonine dehydrogenase-like Zn-dependent dehydrogenase
MQSTAQSKSFEIPETMQAWVLGGPQELSLTQKPVPKPGPAEVLVRVDAVAICGTDLEILHHGLPAMIEGDLPFNKNFTPGHEYLNYGKNYGDQKKGHRANGFTTDGAFAEYAVNHINTLVHVPDAMSDEEATLVVTAGTAMYGLDAIGGLIAGKRLAVTGPGPIGLMGVAVGKALGAEPVILTGTRDARLDLGKKLGADYVVNVRNEDPVGAVQRITGGQGVHYVLECSGAPNALNDAAKMVNRGGRICLAAFPLEPVPVDVAHLVRNNIYVFGIRGEGKGATHRAMALMSQGQFDATVIHTHTFPFKDLPTGIKYQRERIEDAIKVVITMGGEPK